ncbi:MAG TPA: tRNA (adenosine(37)-N6)-threonylcarbamoyltransferase complex dimerization subunit type 1 TsaB [Longimicrobiaceae bacterium]|nr:tRNA (adenosine(37)-N6)-threonylcarbamoyltransferase complex dimerization subunit type 1 TsaB [Longimicrobiaceae bacterium]
MKPILPAGPVLALDSSTSVGSAAVGDASGVLAEVVRDVAAGHSSGLLPAAEQALAAAGLKPADLAAVVVAGGPGSFTGLRIAAATAKGIAQALHLPLFAYSGLMAVAVNGWAASVPVCALFDARRRDVYAAEYSFAGASVEVLTAPQAVAIDQLIARFRGAETMPLFAGEGATLHREEIERELGARVMPPHLSLPRASSLLWLAACAPELGFVDDPTTWEPDYVRASGAERMADTRP